MEISEGYSTGHNLLITHSDNEDYVNSTTFWFILPLFKIFWKSSKPGLSKCL